MTATELKQLRADAARYAYLRDHMLHGVSHPHGSAIGMSEVLFGDDPDEAIDAAMKEKRNRDYSESVGFEEIEN